MLNAVFGVSWEDMFSFVSIGFSCKLVESRKISMD